MRTSIILLCAAFLSVFLDQQTCDAEPVTVAAIAVASSLLTIFQILWTYLPKDPSGGPWVEIQTYQISEQIQILNRNIEEIVGRVPGEVNKLMKLDKIDDELGNIKLAFQEMLGCYTTGVCTDTHIDKAEAFLHPTEQVIKATDTILNKFALGSANLLDYYQKTLKVFQVTCGVDGNIYSAQQILIKYLELIQMTEIKVYLTLGLANEILKNDSFNKYRKDYQKENLTNLLIEDIKNLDNNHFEMIKKFKNVMNNVSRDVWSCDPENHEEDLTFTQLKNVFQGYIISQRNMKLHETTPCLNINDTNYCGGENPTVQLDPRKDTIPNYLGLYRKDHFENICNGYLWNCGKRFEGALNWYNELNICPEEFSSDRRYRYAKVGAKYYGLQQTCSKEEVTEKYEITTSCEICYCICDGKSDSFIINNKVSEKLSDRGFFMEPVTADVSKNHVITGARLRKYKQVVYIEIQEGELLPNGHINEKSLEWKEKPIDSILRSRSNVFQIDWNVRAIELGDIDLPADFVLTGLQFQPLTKNNVRRLTLGARGKPFNFTSGKLGSSAIEKLYGPSLSNEEMDVHEKSLPTKTGNNFVITNKYLKFSTSNFNQDLGQTTIPFIDIQKVTPAIPAPMGGVGLYYKHLGALDKLDHAGYIGLKLKTYNIAPHISLEKLSKELTYKKIKEIVEKYKTESLKK